METREQKIDSFFIQYADRFNSALKGESADIEGTINSFSHCFIEAPPMALSVVRITVN